MLSRDSLNEDSDALLAKILDELSLANMLEDGLLSNWIDDKPSGEVLSMDSLRALAENSDTLLAKRLDEGSLANILDELLPNWIDDKPSGEVLSMDSLRALAEDELAKILEEDSGLLSTKTLDDGPPLENCRDETPASDEPCDGWLSGELAKESNEGGEGDEELHKALLDSQGVDEGDSPPGEEGSGSGVDEGSGSGVDEGSGSGVDELGG